MKAGGWLVGQTTYQRGSIGIARSANPAGLLPRLAWLQPRNGAIDNVRLAYHTTAAASHPELS
jgi:hypothetical protein